MHPSGLMSGRRRHAAMAPVVASVVLLLTACAPTPMSLNVREDGVFTPAEVGGALRLSGLLRSDLAGSRVADGLSPMPGSSRVVVPSTHTITVFPNGTFTPSALTINEGDSVHFVGPSGTAGIIPLRPTDAIVRVNQADIDAAALSGTACMTSTLPYTTDSMMPGDDNELTGPLRRGTSGIYALGPERSDSYFEGPSADTCETIFAAAGSPLAEGETARVVEFPGYEGIAAGAATKLCYKEFRGEKSSRTNSPYMLQSTWDNPDVTGAVIRINWKDLYTMTLVGDMETYTEELVEARHRVGERRKARQARVARTPRGRRHPAVDVQRLRAARRRHGHRSRGQERHPDRDERLRHEQRHEHADQPQLRLQQDDGVACGRCLQDCAAHDAARRGRAHPRQRAPLPGAGEPQGYGSELPHRRDAVAQTLPRSTRGERERQFAEHVLLQHAYLGDVARHASRGLRRPEPRR